MTWPVAALLIGLAWAAVAAFAVLVWALARSWGVYRYSETDRVKALIDAGQLEVAGAPGACQCEECRGVVEPPEYGAGRHRVLGFRPGWHR